MQEFCTPGMQHGTAAAGTAAGVAGKCVRTQMASAAALAVGNSPAAAPASASSMETSGALSTPPTGVRRSTTCWCGGRNARAQDNEKHAGTRSCGVEYMQEALRRSLPHSSPPGQARRTLQTLSIAASPPAAVEWPSPAALQPPAQLLPLLQLAEARRCACAGSDGLVCTKASPQASMAALVVGDTCRCRQPIVLLARRLPVRCWGLAGVAAQQPGLSGAAP